MGRDSAEVLDDVAPTTTKPARRGRAQTSDKHPGVGDYVAFATNTGQQTAGQVIQRVEEGRQPAILLIERIADGWRAFRFENDVSMLPTPEGLVRAAATPVFQSPD